MSREGKSYRLGRFRLAADIRKRLEWHFRKPC